MIIDLVKRFSATPLAAVFPLNGSLLRVSSNSPLLLDRLRLESSASDQNSRHASVIDWRIVVESAGATPDGEFIRHAFSHDGLSFSRISQASFLAGDRRAGWGVSFITTSLVDEEPLFHRYFLPAFISMIDEMAAA